MKLRKFIIAPVWVLLAVLAFSCNESDSVDPQLDSQNAVRENILYTTNAGLERLRSLGIGGPSGAIFGNAFNGRSSRTDMTPSKFMRSRGHHDEETDSTETEEPSCLTESWSEEFDGTKWTYTYTLDFGDGCDVWGEYLKGKLVEEGTYDENSFSSTTTFTEFGGEDWKVDGTHSHAGTWEESVEPENEEDSLYAYNASYEFQADLMEEFIEYGHDEDDEVSTGEEVIQLHYVASGSEEMDHFGYTVTSMDETVQIGTNETFTSQVDVPLHFNFECYESEEDVWVFQSGIESGSYQSVDPAITVNYTIDFGDGACDNIVTYTEDGIIEEVDLGDEWEEWEEECDSEG